MTGPIRAFLFSAASLLIGLGLAAPSAAQVRGYATASVGMLMPPTTDYIKTGIDPITSEATNELLSATGATGTGYTFGGGIGVDLGRVRPEFRVDYHKAPFESAWPVPGVSAQVPPSGLPVLTMMGELHFDIPLVNDWLEVHGGAGLGAAQLRTDIAPDWDMAWSGSAGFYMPRFDPFGIDLTYRYTGLAEGFVRNPHPKYEATRWHAHEISLSLRFFWGPNPEEDE